MLVPVHSSDVVFYRWFFPFIGHMGICTSAGVIRDFAGPYFVSVSQITYQAFYIKTACSHIMNVLLMATLTFHVHNTA